MWPQELKNAQNNPTNDINQMMYPKVQKWGNSCLCDTIPPVSIPSPFRSSFFVPGTAWWVWLVVTQTSTLTLGAPRCGTMCCGERSCSSSSLPRLRTTPPSRAGSWVECRISYSWEIWSHGVSWCDYMQGTRSSYQQVSWSLWSSSIYSSIVLVPCSQKCILTRYAPQRSRKCWYLMGLWEVTSS